MGNSVSVTIINEVSMMMIPKWADQQTVQTVTNPLALNTFAKIMINKKLMTNATSIRVTVRRWKLREFLTLKGNV